MRRWRDLGVGASATVNRYGHEVEVRYRALPGVRDELMELATLEGACCSFVSWSVEDVDGAAVLRVSAAVDRPDDVEPIARMFESATHSRS
jgi:hypothetical protein